MSALLGRNDRYKIGSTVLTGSDGKGWYFGDIMETLVGYMKSCNKVGEVKNNYKNGFVRTVTSERITDDKKKMYINVSTSITPSKRRRIDVSAKDSFGRNIGGFSAMSWEEQKR